MKTYLVTGGAGFIGSTFLIYMANKYSEDYFINYDYLTYAGNLKNVDEIATYPNYGFVKGDIRNRAHLEHIFKTFDIDYVVNFAAETHVDRSIEDPDAFISTNVLGTHVLLDTAKKSWQIGKDNKGYPLYKEGVKYLQVSTDEVYGALGKDGFFTEETKVSPNSPYSASKASGDMLTLAYFNTYHIPVLVTRCSNNYGPRQYPEKLIPLMIKKAINNEMLPVYGDGLQIRDWLHVEDHVSAIDMVLKNGKLGEIYNIGGKNERTNIEIVRLILKMLGKDESQIEHVQDRLGHDRRYAIDNAKISSELNFKPIHTFEEGIKETVEWYLNFF